MALLAVLVVGQSLRADSGHGDGAKGDAGHVHEGDTGEDAVAKDLPGLWSQITAERKAIEDVVGKGELKEVHAKAERLAKLASALGGQSTSLAPDKRTRVEGAAKQLAKVADSLHDAADKDDAGGTKRELGRLNSLLQLIESQYPEGALRSASADKQGAADSHEGGHEHANHMHGERPVGAVDDPPQARLEVNALGMRFDPVVLTVAAGVPTRISLRNADGLEHALVVKAPDGASDWVHLHAPAGKTDEGTYRLNRPGRYPIACTIQGHREAGMVAELVVEPPKR